MLIQPDQGGRGGVPLGHCGGGGRHGVVGGHRGVKLVPVEHGGVGGWRWEE